MEQCPIFHTNSPDLLCVNLDEVKVKLSRSYFIREV